MNAKTLARQYDKLEPIERFGLVLSAEARGDDAEAERLTQSAERINLSMRDFAPHLHAFQMLEIVTLCELLDAANAYEYSFALSDAWAGSEIETTITYESGETYTSKQKQPWQRYLDIALGTGYTLRTKEAGWRLFCERLGVPPFRLWKEFAGWDQLQRALKKTEIAAFKAEGMLAWLNSLRPEGEPQDSTLGLTVQAYADSLSDGFPELVKRYGG